MKNQNLESKFRISKMSIKRKLKSSPIMPSDTLFASPQSFFKALKRTTTAFPQTTRTKIAVGQRLRYPN